MIEGGGEEDTQDKRVWRVKTHVGLES